MAVLDWLRSVFGHQLALLCLEGSHLAHCCVTAGWAETVLAIRRSSSRFQLRFRFVTPQVGRFAQVGHGVSACCMAAAIEQQLVTLCQGNTTL